MQQYDAMKASNSTYSIADALNFMVDVVFLGYSRFLHIEDLRTDQMYARRNVLISDITLNIMGAHPTKKRSASYQAQRNWWT